MCVCLDLDLQAGLAAAAAAQQAPHSVQKPVIGSSSRGTPMRSGKSSSGGGSGGGGSALKKPVWGFFGCKAKSKSKEQSPEEGPQHPQQQQAGGYARMAGPVVVVFVTHRYGQGGAQRHAPAAGWGCAGSLSSNCTH